MEIIICPSEKEASQVAARIVAALVRRKPDAALGLATGDTPLGLYRELVRLHSEENLDFGRVTTFNLDEYVGLPPDHPAAYHAFITRHLLDPLGIAPEQRHIPDGRADDIPAECLRYEDAIRAGGGIDLQVLGIGRDGHIGFNEPTSSLASRTRIKTLTEETRRDNARFFGAGDEVPLHVITMGIGTVMDARTCLLLAFGAHKAEAVAQAVEGPVSAFVPASALQLHPDTRFLLDEAAASKLRRTDYYRWVYAHKPAWQRT